MGFQNRVVIVALLTGVCFAASVAQAFQEIPKESAKALRVTRGKPFSKGAVFVNGKYIEPPYVVERWGTGLRINKIQVTGQIIDWTEFLKTQEGVKVTKEEAASADEPTSSSASEAAEEDSDESSLDDLFDDDPKPKKKSGGASVRKSSTSARPKATVSYSLEGAFVPNDASKALVARINAARTDIDRILRTGGFICFGDHYSQVSGDSRALLQMLEKLPELQQNSSDLQSFTASVRAAHLVYIHEVLCADLFANRIDYRQLKDLRKKLQAAKKWDSALDGLPKPLF